MRYTKNYKLKQPEMNDYVLVEDFNENSDIVDGLIKKIESVIGDLENSEEKNGLIKLIETLQKNKADLGKDGKVVPEQLPEVDLSGIENSIETLGKNALKLGETKTTAYAGDKGKVAYNHSQSTHAPANAYSKEQSDSNLRAIRNEALKLGTTSTTAYRGDHGLLAYNHSQSTHAPTNAYSKEQSDSNLQAIRNEALKLGTTSTTAYRGDHGLLAYNHSQSTHAPTNAYSKEQSDSNLQAIRNEALKLGTTSTTAYRGDHGLLAYNHSRSNHADPNAITENKAKELLEEFTQMTRVKADKSDSYIDLVKIKNTVFATLNSISNGSFNCTIPVGFRPKNDHATYIPYDNGQYGKTSIGVSTTGKVTRDLNKNDDLRAVSGSTISWEV